MKLALGIALVLLAGTADAQFRTGNKLLAELQSDSIVDRMFAVGYVTGVADALDQSLYCLQNGMTIGQVSDTIQVALERTPQIRNEPADVLIVAILSKHYPCKGRKQS